MAINEHISSLLSKELLLSKENFENFMSCRHSKCENEKAKIQYYSYLKSKMMDICAIKANIREANDDNFNSVKKIIADCDEKKRELGWILKEKSESQREREEMITERDQQTNLINESIIVNQFAKLPPREKARRLREIKKKLNTFEYALLQKKKDCDTKYNRNVKLKSDNLILIENIKQKQMILFQLNEQIQSKKAQQLNQTQSTQNKSVLSKLKNIFK